MKSSRRSQQRNVYASLPVQGAWIEISAWEDSSGTNRSLPVQGAWIEIENDAFCNDLLVSLPVQGAWIEIVAG